MAKKEGVILAYFTRTTQKSSQLFVLNCQKITKNFEFFPNFNMVKAGGPLP